MQANHRSAWVLKTQACKKMSISPPGTLQHRVGASHYDEQLCDGEMGEEEKLFKKNCPPSLATATYQ